MTKTVNAANLESIVGHDAHHLYDLFSGRTFSDVVLSVRPLLYTTDRKRVVLKNYGEVTIATQDDNGNDVVIEYREVPDYGVEVQPWRALIK